jgi:hypothetical protein
VRQIPNPRHICLEEGTSAELLRIVVTPFQWGGRDGDEPIDRHYVRLLEGGTKPNLAKLTIARQIALIALCPHRAAAAELTRRRSAGKPPPRPGILQPGGSVRSTVRSIRRRSTR